MSRLRLTYFVFAWLIAATAAAAAAPDIPASSPVTALQVTPTSLVTRADPAQQRVDLAIQCTGPIQSCVLRVFSGERQLTEKTLGPLCKGANTLSVLLDEPKQATETRWVLSDGQTTLAESTLTWTPPRHWTLYVLKSAHVDIGLHDSQYKQRYMTDSFLDDAQRLAGETGDWPDASRFRYVVEGLWWWFNYPQDRSEQAANELVSRYVKHGIFDIGASHSGNHTQVFGVEELCRSSYYRRQLQRRWDLPAETMLMIDNNGITWPLVTAYADAGIKNLIFLPNSWNPQTVGGTRIEVGWDSPLPHLFYWEGPDSKSRILVWANPHYIGTGKYFGIQTCEGRGKVVTTAEEVAPKMAKQLALLESRYPYDVWLVSNYDDNEVPGLGLAELCKKWNAAWRWPEVRTLGDLSEPFRQVESRFGDKIPTLRGDITGGWAQHPLSTPSLLAQKREADRQLPVAEKLATLARLADPDFVYPTVPLRRAWDGLICNDEHGYGVSNYKGRPVYDTWMQKRDWIQRAQETAKGETARAIKALAAQVPAESQSILVFNPTLQTRSGIVELDMPDWTVPPCIRYPDDSPAPIEVVGRQVRFESREIPPLGYALYRLSDGDLHRIKREPREEPPTVENTFYRVSFERDGTIKSIFDKELQRELIDPSAPHRANQFLYTNDAHKTLSSPSSHGGRHVGYHLETSQLGQTVVAEFDDRLSNAAAEQRVTLPHHEKRIDIENNLWHVRDLASKDRWNRFGYYAFPFDVPGGVFRVGLNGCVARPRDDQTGHGTEAYLAARDWTDVAGDQFGVALVQYDSCLVECGKIHANKTEFGQPITTSHLYSYVLNDWLYAHAYTTGPSNMNFQFRYSILSHEGGVQDDLVARFAERTLTPLVATVIAGPQKGRLPTAPHSFLSVDASNVELVALKLSETPGRGVIARFHETGGKATDKVNVRIGFGEDARLTSCSVMEEDRNVLDEAAVKLAPFGFATLRIEGPTPDLPAPAPSVGKCTDKSVALAWSRVAGACQYQVYRGENADFPADEFHFLATTGEPQYTDDWLKCGTAYHYRVAAVSADTSQGHASDAVSATTDTQGDSPPAKVGFFYTGLITDPRAWRGDEPNVLYLQWGQNQEPDLSHYELYRGQRHDFSLNDETFLAKVEPGPYVVVPYEDKGLRPNATYFYRVRAVDRDGHKGEPSKWCDGTTRQMLSTSGSRPQ